MIVAAVGNEVGKRPMYLLSPAFNRLPQITSIARFSRRSVRNRRTVAPGDYRLRARVRRVGCGSAIRTPSLTVKAIVVGVRV